MKKIFIALSAVLVLVAAAYLITPRQHRLGDNYRLADQQKNATLPPQPVTYLNKDIEIFYFKKEDTKCTEAVGVAMPDLDKRVQFQEITALNALLTGPTPAGYYSAMIPATPLTLFTVRDGVATVDLGYFLIIGQGTCTKDARIQQVLKTLNQFGSLKAIKLLEDGKEVYPVEDPTIKKQ